MESFQQKNLDAIDEIEDEMNTLLEENEYLKLQLQDIDKKEKHF